MGLIKFKRGDRVKFDWGANPATEAFIKEFAFVDNKDENVYQVIFDDGSHLLRLESDLTLVASFKVGDEVGVRGTTICGIIKEIVDNKAKIPLSDYVDGYYEFSDIYKVYQDSAQECSHKWIDIGFNFTKEVCYYCDKEK